MIQKSLLKVQKLKLGRPHVLLDGRNSRIDSRMRLAPGVTASPWVLVLVRNSPGSLINLAARRLYPGGGAIRLDQSRCGLGGPDLPRRGVYVSYALPTNQATHHTIPRSAATAACAPWPAIQSGHGWRRSTTRARIR